MDAIPSLIAAISFSLFEEGYVFIPCFSHNTQTKLPLIYCDRVYKQILQFDSSRKSKYVSVAWIVCKPFSIPLYILSVMKQMDIYTLYQDLYYARRTAKWYCLLILLFLPSCQQLAQKWPILEVIPIHFWWTTLNLMKKSWIWWVMMTTLFRYFSLSTVI